MGGYSAIFNSTEEIIRGDMYIYSSNGINDAYGGSASNLYVWSFNDVGTPQTQITRTPSGFADNPNNIWQIDAMQYNPGGYTAIVAHAAPNLDLYSSANTPVYYGDISQTTDLIPIQDSVQPSSICLPQSISQNSICLAQAISSSMNATLNGVLVTSGVAYPNAPQSVVITSNSSLDTTQMAAISGADVNGNPQSQSLTFSGFTPVHTTDIYSSVTSVAISSSLMGNLAVGTIGDLAINGSFAQNGVAVFDQPRQVTIVSTSASDTSQTALITGFDANGNPLTQTLTFNGITPVTSTDLFAAVSSVYINAFLTGQVQVGTASVTLQVSGGICAVYPYLFVYGNNGLVQWSAAGNLTDFNIADGSGQQNISAQKVVRGEPDRSSGSSQPAIIFWTLDKLVRGNFTQLTESSSVVNTFGFSEIPGYSGIVSSSAIVEFDGIYYWPSAQQRFEMYNGVVQELPNNLNLLWFYQNLNWTYRQKVWGVKNSAWGEIWWFFPFGGSTECNAAIIYNVRLQCWYSTMLSRSAGVYAKTFQYPVMSDNQLNDLSLYNLWQHEIGTDEVQGSSIQPIEKYIQSCEFSFLGSNPIGLPQGIDSSVFIDRVELDLVQTGEMTFTFLGRDFPRQIDVTSSTVFQPDTVDIEMQWNSRQPRIQLTSNTVGGSYQLGRNAILAKLSGGDNTYGGSIP